MRGRFLALRDMYVTPAVSDASSAEANQKIFVLLSCDGANHTSKTSFLHSIHGNQHFVLRFCDQKIFFSGQKDPLQITSLPSCNIGVDWCTSRKLRLPHDFLVTSKISVLNKNARRAFECLWWHQRQITRLCCAPQNGRTNRLKGVRNYTPRHDGTQKILTNHVHIKPHPRVGGQN